MNIIFFDTSCLLCSKAVSFIIKRDKNNIFFFASLEGKKAQSLKHKNINSIVYVKDEKEFIYSEAVLEILKDIGGRYQYLSVLRVLPKVLRDGIYKFIAKHRYKVFGKKESCLVIDKELSTRLL